MEDLTLTTPALLFSALSLLMLAFTNRFLALAQLVRNIYAENKANPGKVLEMQIQNLRKRLRLIREIQIFGMASLLLCVVCMFLIYINLQIIAIVTFGIALLFLIVSLTLSVWEITISVNALDYQLNDVIDTNGKKNNEA